MGGGLALPFSRGETASAQAPIYLADMHFHSFFGNSVHHSRPVAEALAQGPASLVSWALTGDVHWFDWKRTFKQTSEPKPGEAMGWFERELARIKAHATEQKLKFVLTPADVDRALAGDPHIVLSVEGANFIEKPAHVQRAYDLGVRHLQLVHYTRSLLGDFTDGPANSQRPDRGRPRRHRRVQPAGYLDRSCALRAGDPAWRACRNKGSSRLVARIGCVGITAPSRPHHMAGAPACAG